MHEREDTEESDGPTTPMWRQVLFTWVLPIVGAIVLFQAVGWLRAPDLPSEAPGFTVVTPEGEALRLSDYRGHTVVLNFWATWCGPCRLEAPSFDSFAANNPDIVVLGLASDRNAALVRKTAASLGIRYPVALAGPETLKDYGVTTFPTTVIVDPEGHVRAAHTGILLRPQLWMLTQL